MPHLEPSLINNLDEIRSCSWKQDRYGIFYTDCGNAFEFNSDGVTGPEENGFEYCPYCGRKLEDDR